MPRRRKTCRITAAEILTYRSLIKSKCSSKRKRDDSKSSATSISPGDTSTQKDTVNISEHEDLTELLSDSSDDDKNLPPEKDFVKIENDVLGFNDGNDADDEDECLSSTSHKCRLTKTCIGECTPSQAKKQSVRLDNDEIVLNWSPMKSRNIPMPNFSWADSKEMAQLICAKEDLAASEKSFNAFKKHPELSPRMRSILYDWLMEVAEVYKLRRITYYLTIDYIDRYISKCESMPKNQLQLLGITCLFIAAKVEEIYPPRLLELAYVTDGACSEEQILAKEMTVLKVLDWDVYPTTVPWWLNLYLQLLHRVEIQRVSNGREETDDNFIFPQFSGYAYMRACQLLDLCSLDYNMMQFQYSFLAAAAIYYTYNREKALFVSGLRWDKLKPCVKMMAPYVEVITKSQLKYNYDPPIECTRLATGLRRRIPNIVVDEHYAIQKKCVDLKMLQQVYDLIETWEERKLSEHSSSSSSEDIEVPDSFDEEEYKCREKSCDKCSQKTAEDQAVPSVCSADTDVQSPTDK